MHVVPKLQLGATWSSIRALANLIYLELTLIVNSGHPLAVQHLRCRHTASNAVYSFQSVTNSLPVQFLLNIAIYFAFNREQDQPQLKDLPEVDPEHRLAYQISVFVIQRGLQVLVSQQQASDHYGLVILKRLYHKIFQQPRRSHLDIERKFDKDEK
ncbi:hypothetical protein LTS10_003375 [Elasticomyces elasticus]|nr:hypothetical protein LTS10_003375 [Elasticomyces elasticus]